MKIRVFVALLFTVALVQGLAYTQKSMTLEELRGKKKSAIKTKVTPTPNTDKAVAKKGGLMKEGSYSKFDKPFLFVARDAATYGMLGSMIEDFEPKDVDFTKDAVVAAFSGAKETGGYSVSVKLKDGKCEIKDISPPHGAIVTDALTRPYAVAVIPVEEDKALEIVAEDTWKNGLTKYRITNGSFEFSGGFIGVSKKYDVEGTISILRHGPYVTMFFNFREKGKNSIRGIAEAGSGMIDKKMPTIRRIEGGNLIDRPHPPLKVKVVFGENKLNIDFVPGKRDYVVSDGYEGSGKVEAELISVS